jgi:hypothetical protein
MKLARVAGDRITGDTISAAIFDSFIFFIDFPTGLRLWLQSFTRYAS